MAFWGVQVKPKKPFKLRFDEFEGAQLRLTQATLGSKITDERTIVKCKVGVRPPVFLCSLLPGVVETCSLDLYFSEDVTFSVKGSTSVHLVGYYEGRDNENDEETGEEEDTDDGVEYEDDDDWYPSEVKRSPEMPASEPVGVQENQEMPLRTEVPKKAKKKKKAAKKTPEQEVKPLNQADGSAMTPSTQSANEVGGKVEEHDTQAVNGGEKPYGKKGTVRKYPNGFEVENIGMGKPDGKQAKPGKRVGMIYIGKLKANGKVFDSNVGRKPFEFRLGVGEVIKGWDIGVNGMRVGDRRRLVIPPAMGYGQKGVPGIPPNSWLAFDVELVYVK